MTIEYTVLNYLISKMDIPVYMEEPSGNDETYILIEKTGSSEENKIYTAIFAIQSYGRTMEQAIDLNELVKKAMEEFNDSPDIFSCDLNSDYNFTDTETKRYRYQAVFEITY